LADLPDDRQAEARFLFVTHSIPLAMNDGSGPGGAAYRAQHLELADEVMRSVAAATGRQHAYDLAYCSRSGSPAQPWLEPDVNDHLRRLAVDSARAVVVVPIGFVSDHMEVRHDLDTEAAATARELGIELRRADTAGVRPAFVSGLVDLLEERAAEARGEAPERPVIGTLGPWPSVCVAGCCPNPREARAAACGADWVAPRLVEAAR
jgi:ferrochelatase